MVRFSVVRFGNGPFWLWDETSCSRVSVCCLEFTFLEQSAQWSVPIVRMIMNENRMIMNENKLHVLLGSSHYSDSHYSDSYFSDTHNFDSHYSDTH